MSFEYTGNSLVGPIIAGLIAAVILLVTIWVAVRVIARFRVSAAEFGYGGVRKYLRAIPKTDAERADAIELTMRGGLICLVGAIFPLIVLVGMFPLYYGVRKLLYVNFESGAGTDQHVR